MPEPKTCEQCKNAIPLGAFNVFLNGKIYCSACFNDHVKKSLPPPCIDATFATQPAKVELRDWLAAHETLKEWEDFDMFEQRDCEFLAGRPKPKHGWRCETREQLIETLQWEADWRAALKYIRADAMLKARAQ